jgi:hypothetical protein
VKELNPFKPTEHTHPQLGTILRNRRRREFVLLAIVYTLPLWPAIVATGLMTIRYLFVFLQGKNL